MPIPTDLPQLLEIIRVNGDAAYMFVFSYAAANSLILTLFAGYAAHMGALDVGKVILVCWAGSVVGDGIRFWIGRRFGSRWLKRFPRLERAVMSVVRLVDSHYGVILLVHRYPHGIRGIAAFACGIARVPTGSFMAINTVAAAIWAILIVAIGYAFGHLSEKILTNAASGLSFAALLIFLGLFWLLSKKLEQAIERKEGIKT